MFTGDQINRNVESLKLWLTLFYLYWPKRKKTHPPIKKNRGVARIFVVGEHWQIFGPIHNFGIFGPNLILLHVANLGLLFQRLWAVGPNFGLRSNKKRSSPVKFGPNGIFVMGGSTCSRAPPLATPLVLSHHKVSGTQYESWVDCCWDYDQPIYCTMICIGPKRANLRRWSWWWYICKYSP